MTEANDMDQDNRQTREYEAGTAEEAIEMALADLNLPRERIQIKIISEGQKGLFGMQGAKKAKIRITIIPEKREPSK